MTATIKTKNMKTNTPTAIPAVIATGSPVDSKVSGVSVGFSFISHLAPVKPSGHMHFS